jgi:hypothetical protein
VNDSQAGLRLLYISLVSGDDEILSQSACIIVQQAGNCAGVKVAVWIVSSDHKAAADTHEYRSVAHAVTCNCITTVCRGGCRADVSDA